jgi:hypothetical protein
VRLDRERQPHLVAERALHAVHAEVAALDREGRLEAGDLAAAALAQPGLVDLDGERLGLAVEAELAGDLEAILAERLDRLALKPICGNSEALSRSGPRQSSSRLALFVSMLADSIVISTALLPASRRRGRRGPRSN